MEKPDDFIVIEEEPINSIEQAMNKLYLLIDVFNKSIDAVNQSNILLKDELRLALDVTLQNIKPHSGIEHEELLEAFESKLTSPDETRQNYIKHLLSRIVSVNVQNQAYQHEIEDNKNVNETQKSMVREKLQQAMSSLNVIQATLNMFESTSSHGGDISSIRSNAETTGQQKRIDQSGGDNKQDRETVHAENSSPSDDEVSATLTDLCKRLSDVQLRVAKLPLPFDNNTAVLNSGQCQSESCVETSSFYTVDDKLSLQSCDAASPGSTTATTLCTNEIESMLRGMTAAPGQLAASRSLLGGDANEKAQGTASLKTLQYAAFRSRGTDPAKSGNLEQNEAASPLTLEAACQWMGTPPTRLISGNEPILPQPSNSNIMATPPAIPTSRNELLLPQPSNSNATAGDRILENRSPMPRSEPHCNTPTFTADEEIPWCPGCQHQFASRSQLEDHLWSCLT